jgi:UDP-GlcNAc:undecaprenyl-phosphate GlcNAc-1-phosphate transferase
LVHDRADSGLNGAAAAMNATVESYSAALIILVAGFAALAVSQLVSRMLALSDFLLDRPNGRSSHEVVTPRSGGVAIFSGWLVGIVTIGVFAGWTGFTKEAAMFAPLLAAAFLFGLADDRFNLNASLKFFTQIALAVFYVAIFGPLTAAPLPFLGETSLGPWAAPLTVLWIVGFMNAYNFMDGVNGIAAACGALALATLAAAAAFNGETFWAIACGLCAASLLSFLPMNFPRARLFMGDNGSQAVGFLFAVASVGVANDTDGAVSAYFGPLLMLPFLADVAFTLIHRARRGRNILSAHREHLYQLMARLGLSHAEVTAAFLSLTALSSAVAILQLRLPAAYQLLAPIALSAAFLLPALKLFERARRSGLLDRKTEELAPPIEPIAVEPLQTQAAE